VVDHQPAEAAGQTDEYGDCHHPLQSTAEHECGGSGQDEQCGDEEASGDAHADDDGHRHQKHQHIMQDGDADAGDLGHERVEGVVEDFLEKRADGEDDGGGQGDAGEHGFGRHIADAAEEIVLPHFGMGTGAMLVVDRERDESPGKAGDEEDADGRVIAEGLAVAAFACDVTDAQGHRQTKQHRDGVDGAIVGEDGKREREQPSGSDATEARVGDAFTDEGPTAEDDDHAEDGAGGAHCAGREEGTGVEREGDG